MSSLKDVLEGVTSPADEKLAGRMESFGVALAQTFKWLTTPLALIIAIHLGVVLANAHNPVLFGGQGTFPLRDMNSTVYSMERKDFEVLGPVVAEVTAEWQFGMASATDAGDMSYATLLQKAMVEKGADDVMNVRLDQRVQTSLFGLKRKVTVRLRGMAVKWR